jgi:NADP-dependent 3-hydroxy acid dehydrogenase YdfG
MNNTMLITGASSGIGKAIASYAFRFKLKANTHSFL